jgi:hypothetical protein
VVVGGTIGQLSFRIGGELSSNNIRDCLLHAVVIAAIRIGSPALFIKLIYENMSNGFNYPKG